jgi:predicted neutral ceramidase superfamily lipid hydrolase
MKSIKDIRAAIDSGLDKVQAKAEAAAKQVSLSTDELNSHIETQEDKLKTAATDLRAKLDDIVSEENKTKIQGAVDHLHVQLALGAADSRDAFNTKKQEVQRAIAELNAKLDAADAAEEREAEVGALIAIYVAEAIAMEAEMEAMHEQYEDKEG